MLEVLDTYQVSVKRKCENGPEGPDESGGGPLLIWIYTELHIIELREEVHSNHEMN